MKLEDKIERIMKIKHIIFGSNTRIILTSWVCIVFTIALFLSFVHKKYDLVQFFGGMIASIAGIYTTARTFNKVSDNKKDEEIKQ